MQFCLNNYLNSNENVNALLRAPTGSGKSSGIVAVQSNVSNSCLIFSPMSTNAWQSLVKELMPHVPYMTVTKEKRSRICSNWETMGRISGDKPKKFAEAVLKLREIRKQRRSIRIEEKNNVFATFPRVILVHPDLRYNGIASITKQVLDFMENDSAIKGLKPILVVDDFSGSDDDLKHFELFETIGKTKNCLLLTATPPESIDSINNLRKENNLDFIEIKDFPITLGQGSQLIDTTDHSLGNENHIIYYWKHLQIIMVILKKC